ncbi:MAG: hypothetical protein GY829_11040 [Gammaproteobacteria bacterium]|nr:hypothetical protein [Gammaproteobacteria bacterium]
MSHNNIFIGVDPGATGYICLLRPSTSEAYFISNSFDHPSQIFNEVKAHLQGFHCPMIMIEDVHSIFGASAKSNFQFGRNVGLIHGILGITHIGIDLVSPKLWQKEVGIKIPGPKFKGATRKKMLKQAVADTCKRLYPAVNIYGLRGGLIDGKSDALMIAHYCYLKYK